jgi:hypothetical protein
VSSVCVIGALSIGGCGSGGAHVEKTQHVAAWTQSARGAFAVLASRATPEDSLPRVFRGSQMSVRSARDPTLVARRLFVGPSVWFAVEQDRRLCLLYIVAPLLAGTNQMRLPSATVRQCASLAESVAGRLVVTQSYASRGASGAVLVMGVVPNGVGTVVVGSAAGRHDVVRVSRNGYRAMVREPAFVQFRYYRAGRTVRGYVPIFAMGGSYASR